MELKSKIPLERRFNQHKRMVLRLLLLLSGLAVILFATVNYFRGKYLLFIVEMLGACIAFLLLYLLRLNPDFKHFQRIALAYVLLFCLFLLF